MSLRWKIALALSTVGVVVSVALGALTYRSTDQRLLDEVDQSIAQVADLAVGGNDRFPARRQVVDVYSLRRLGPDGRVEATSFESDVPVGAAAGVVSGQPGLSTRETVTASDGERFRIHTLGASTGSVQIARSLDETDAVLDDLRRRTVFLVAMAAVGLALVGWVIAGRVAAPLRRLARSADEVRSTGRLDVAMPDLGAGSNDEVGQLGRAFTAMLAALGRSRSEQERLVQDAGHELRTPLTSLRTNLAVLRRHQDMPSEMRTQILDDLDGEVTELTELVNELVTVASGELSAQPAERLDLSVVAHDVAERVGRRRSRRVEVDAREGAFVVAPRAGVERAVSNIVENACKFDGTGAVIEVVVTIAEPTAGPTAERTVEFRVADRGPGVPQEDLERVFDRFHRTDATRSMPGSGLGLAIVRDVVESHGGAVSAANRDGGGAVIGFDLPLAPS